MNAQEPITIQTTVKADIENIWNRWIEPKHIQQWNSPSIDWHTPKANNDLREGGRFTFRMEAKDGSMGFDFGGTYTNVEPQKHIAYTLDDDRKVTVDFEVKKEGVLLVETFEPENQNPIAMQRDGWQAILNNFKKYVESQ